VTRRRGHARVYRRGVAELRACLRGRPRSRDNVRRKGVISTGGRRGVVIVSVGDHISLALRPARCGAPVAVWRPMPAQLARQPAASHHSSQHTPPSRHS